MHVLYVEDDPALRYAIGREMRKHGYTVYEADSGESAMLLLAAHRVDVLVSDVGLPGESGEVLAAAVREVQPDVRVIFATGLDWVKGVVAPDRGPTVLRKPYTWTALAEALRSPSSAPPSGTRHGEA
jgi:DNA-binding response OmpR family regulator